MTFAEAQSVLAAAGVRFAAGMTADEFARVERRFGFRFPLDLREFLAAGLPVSDGWVDWRGSDEATILAWLRWPLEGICSDIECNGFWLPEWGARPPGLPDAFAVARQAVAQAPMLIPILGRRYIPSPPADPGNPVFSVYQTDIIHYGANLMDYVQNEFSYAFGRPGYAIRGTPRCIPFWSRLVEENGDPTGG